METIITSKDLDLAKKYLGSDTLIIDAHPKSTHVLKETQAIRRKELVSDIEYNYSLALNHGDYFLGQALICF